MELNSRWYKSIVSMPWVFAPSQTVGVSSGHYPMGLWRTRLILLYVGLCGIALAGLRDDTSPKAEITYNKDVAPVLNRHCVACHRPNDIAPMSLMTYEEVLPFARIMRESVVQRKMPPWHADPAFGEFSNEARLTDEEIAIIDAWVKNGTKKGAPEASTADTVLAQGWHIKPEVVMTVPELLDSKTAPYDYEFLFITTNFTEANWIK